MMYEAPNTAIIDDSNEFAQYFHSDKEDLQTRHEVLQPCIVYRYFYKAFLSSLFVIYDGIKSGSIDNSVGSTEI
jgi:hypothetical protein